VVLEMEGRAMLIYLQMIETEEDKVKFEQIYETYRDLMFHVASQILRNDHDAEDAVHQAFISIIQNLDKISRAECLKTRGYVVITVERKALDIIRANKRYTDLNEKNLSGLEIPLPGDSRLADALATLPARYREILLLRYDYGYTQKELCKILDLSGPAVQKLLWRAKKALSDALEKEAN